jgi:hypothetical protein
MFRVSLRIWVKQTKEFKTAKEAYERGRSLGFEDEDTTVSEERLRW